MFVIKNELLSKGVMLSLILLFVAGCAVVITFPFTLSKYLMIFPDYYGQRSDYNMFVTPFCMLAGALGLWIDMELILILRTISGDPFVPRNIMALRRMFIAATTISLLFALKCFLYLTPLSLAFALAMLLCGLFSLILSGVFAAAVEYKRENELTI